MRSKWSAIAKELMPSPNDDYTHIKTKHGTQEIIDVIMQVHERWGNSLDEIAPYIAGNTDMRTFRNIYEFVKGEITYVQDDPKHERVKSPAMTYYDGFGDCKSMAIMTGALLQSLGYRNWTYRLSGVQDPFTGVKDTEVRHIYVAVQHKGREVIIDPTFMVFDAELPPTIQADYSCYTGACELSSTKISMQVNPYLKSTLKTVGYASILMLILATINKKYV